ncbi:MAG: antibiotic biosynthesis monooxygenase [Candidatus Dormibacteraceae bacterium]
MFLRATRIQAPPDKVEQAIENFETNVVKGLRSVPGNQGAVLLIDRHSGAALGITYWESAKALAASEQTGAQTRTQAVKNVPGTQIVNVERAELMIMDRAGAPKAGTFVRLVTANGDPEKLDAAIVQIRNHVLPVLKALKGYRAAIASVDRQTGRLSVSTVWDTKADLEASETKMAGPRAEVAKIAGAGPHDVQVEIFESAVVELSAAAATQTATRV